MLKINDLIDTQTQGNVLLVDRSTWCSHGRCYVL